MTYIEQNLELIRRQIHNACAQAGRPADSVRLLAVGKTKPAEDLLTAYRHGQRAFGENYVQEGVDKIRRFQAENLAPEWHFIGPLQSNKSKLVAEYFDWMQTLARAKIADRLNEQRPADKLPLNVLIQINISGEASKSGVRPEEMAALAKHIEDLPRLRLRGLMAIPAVTDDKRRQTAAFKRMNELFRQLQDLLPERQIDTLSMGMTDDMQTAIQCGSTMVRIGTAIFGKRDYAHK